MTSPSVQVQDHNDLQQLQSFLERNELPFKDIKLDGNLFKLFYDKAGNIIGSGGLEIYGDDALMRSIAVSHTERGKQLGQRIVDDLIQDARQLQIRSIFLLTETAHDFFLRKGFVDTIRDEVPAVLKMSSEFSFVCPASAKCMRYTL